jgi:hypothetical protein
MHVDLFSYRVTNLDKTRLCRVWYAPGYGLMSSETTTNGSWWGLVDALCTLDPQYTKIPDHQGMVVEPVDVPPQVLTCAVGFLELWQEKVRLQDKVVNRGNADELTKTLYRGLDDLVREQVVTCRIILEQKIRPNWVDGLPDLVKPFGNGLATRNTAQQMQVTIEQEIARQGGPAPRSRVVFVRTQGSARAEILIAASDRQLDMKMAALGGIICWA